MSSPVGGARQDGGGGGRELKLLRQSVRENSLRISKIETRLNWFGGFLSANVLIAIFNLIRGLSGDPS